MLKGSTQVLKVQVLLKGSKRLSVQGYHLLASSLVYSRVIDVLCGKDILCLMFENDLPAWEC